MVELIYVALCFGIALALAIHRASLWLWAAAAAVALITWQSGLVNGHYATPEPGFLGLLAWVPVVILALLAVPALRRSILIEPAFRMVKGILPKVSDTEQQALDAGTVGFDAELFSGQPDWNKLRAIPGINLTAEERAFLDGPTEQLCQMIDDWKVRFQEKEIPDEIWDFVKKHGFLGMLISKSHGGLGFSAQAQSLILGKVASRSPDVSTIVMVPNSQLWGASITNYSRNPTRRIDIVVGISYSDDVDGAMKVLQGMTSVDEVMRVTAEDAH